MTVTISRRALMAAGAALIPAATLPAANTAHAQAGPYTWTQVPFGAGGFIDGFAYHPSEKGLLYARTDVGGLYRFDPANRRWLPLLDHLGRSEGDLMGVLSLALDPRDPDRVYAACGEYLGDWALDGAVLCSADRGITWSKTSLGAGVKLGGNAAGRGTGERLQVDPNHGDILLLGTSQNGLMKSQNCGKSFSGVAFPSKNITLVLFDADSGQAGSPTPVLYVGSGDDKAGGLYRSRNGGGSFTRVEGLPTQFPQRAVLDEAGNLYVTFSNGLAPWGGDNGSLWRVDAATGKAHDISPMQAGTNGVSFAYCGVDIDRSRPGTIVVSTMNRWALHDDIYLSRDGGKSWTAMAERSRHDAGGYPWLVGYLKGEDRMGHWIADVKIDPHNSDALIYGTGYGLWLTDDLGHIDGKDDVHFAFAVDNLDETCSIALASPTGGATLMVAHGDVSGAAYDDLAQQPKAGLFTPNWETNRSVDFASLNPGFVARTSDQARTSGYYSEDGGASWTPFASSPRTERDAKGDYNGAGVIAVSARGAAMVWSPEKQGAFYSVDKGRTWKASEGWPVSRDTGLGVIADRVLDGVFYCHDRVGRQILISTDSGGTFQPIVKGLPEVFGWQAAQLVTSPFRMRDLWLALPSGLFHSPDASAQARPCKGVDEAWLVALGKAAPGKTHDAVYLYGKVKGQEGLWRSDDNGEAWVRINDDRHQYGVIRALAADPLEYGTVYIGPHGRGVFAGRPV